MPLMQFFAQVVAIQLMWRRATLDSQLLVLFLKIIVLEVRVQRVVG